MNMCLTKFDIYQEQQKLLISFFFFFFLKKYFCIMCGLKFILTNVTLLLPENLSGLKNICIFTPDVFFKFLKLYKWYKIAQSASLIRLLTNSQICSIFQYWYVITLFSCHVYLHTAIDTCKS